MKTITQIALAFLAAGCLLVSCNKAKETTGDTDNSAAPSAPAAPIDQAKDMLSKLTSGFEKVVVALESVTDKASAEAAAETIKSTSTEMAALAPLAQELENKLSEEEKTTMENTAEASMKPVMKRMTAAMQKAMASPETAEILKPAMDAFNKAMAPPKATPAPAN